MRKRFLSLILVLAIAVSFSNIAFAADEVSQVTPLKPLPAINTSNLPAVQVMWTETHMNSVGGVSPTIGFRNNSSKTIKYIDWYLTAYNAVGDPVRCDITGKSTAIAEDVGPIAPFTPSREAKIIHTYSFISDDDPFQISGYTGYYINHNGGRCYVDVDKYGNFYATYSSSSIYLTDDEIAYGLYDNLNISPFEICWYNYSIDYFRVTKAVVTFMDGSKTTISGNKLYSAYYNHTLSNRPFKECLTQYSSVYNYSDYLRYNPDLVAIYGSDQKELFEHFTKFGMKEGRQGSREFNLATYKANNPDLVALFGDDNAKYYEHYIASGKAEGRKAAEAPYESVRNFLAAS